MVGSNKILFKAGKHAKQNRQKIAAIFHFYTGKSFSETFILASTNPQYDKRLFIGLPVQYLHENYKLRMLCT